MTYQAPAELVRDIAEKSAENARLRRKLDRIEALAESFRENGLAEWSGTDIAHMIHANLEGETK